MITVHKEDLGACLGIYIESNQLSTVCITQFVDGELGAVLNLVNYGPKPDLSVFWVGCMDKQVLQSWKVYTESVYCNFLIVKGAP